MKRTWFERGMDLLFPPRCPFCGRLLLHTGVCPKCLAALPWTENAVRHLPGGPDCAAPLWYEGLAREGLLRLKFRDSPAGAQPLGELAARCAAACFPGAFDTVTWVPVSRRRRWQRGYDQSRLLARSVGRCLGLPVMGLLEKTVDNPAQSGIADAAARRANVLGVYRARSGALGRRVLLVDDICTTGATLCECARELRLAGAQSVTCVAAALSREKKVHKNTEE